MQMNWVYFCGSIPDDATESVATHGSRLQPPIMVIGHGRWQAGEPK